MYLISPLVHVSIPFLYFPPSIDHVYISTSLKVFPIKRLESVWRFCRSPCSLHQTKAADSRKKGAGRNSYSTLHRSGSQTGPSSHSIRPRPDRRNDTGYKRWERTPRNCHVCGLESNHLPGPVPTQTFLLPQS